MKFISLTGDAVLATRVPNEEMISIETTELTMTLGRHSPDKLVGLKIDGRGGTFVLPEGDKALETKTHGAGFVDTQVRISITFTTHSNLILSLFFIINGGMLAWMFKFILSDVKTTYQLTQTLQ